MLPRLAPERPSRDGRRVVSDPPRELLSTDALPIAVVVMPRELTPQGAPAPVDREPPVRSTLEISRRMAWLIGGVLALWLASGLVIGLAAPDRAEQIVPWVLVVTGLLIAMVVLYDAEPIYVRRRRQAWIRLFRHLGGQPRKAQGDHAAYRIELGPRAFAVEVGTDDYGLACIWARALPKGGDALVPLTMGRRSTARRCWPTGDAGFDARVGVRGPLDTRVMVLGDAERAEWAALIGDYDVTVEDGRLFFSLAYAPRSTRQVRLRKLLERLCGAAALLVYDPETGPQRLARLAAETQEPVVAANALRALRGLAPGQRITADVQQALLTAENPFQRLYAAEVAGDEDTLIGLLGVKAQEIRRRAVAALVEIWPIDSLAERLDLLLDYPEPAVRGAALSFLGERSLPLSDARLAAAVTDPDPDVAEGLLDWLQTATGPQVEAALEKLLKHPEPRAVHRAADRLGRVGSARAEDALVELTRTRAHRRAARNALLQLRQRYPKSLGGAPIIRR